MRLGGEHHHCRDGAGTGEHRHREWRERRVVLDLTLHDLWSTLLRASLRMQHVHGDEPEDQAAGDAERGQRDTEQLKDERAADGEGDENERGGNAGAPRRRRPLRRRLAPRDDEVAGDDGDRVDDEENGCEGDERELGDRRHGTNVRRSGAERQSLGALRRLQERLRDELRFRGTFAPFFRASDSPIAIACLRFFTLPPCPLLPRLSVPCLRRRIALSTRLLAAFPYFRPPDLRPRFFAAM